MGTVAAAYGYIPEGDSVTNWGANFIIDHPLEINKIMKVLIMDNFKPSKDCLKDKTNFSLLERVQDERTAAKTLYRFRLN